MNREEFIQAIADKKKGVLPTPKESAEILTCALQMGDEILIKMKEIDENKAVLANLKVYFPVIYREAYRIFNKKPETHE